jgi:7,8-dihydropterin-6-yl-methyl-4-(beta-D-ribofuranosyl)aminobenzene 5'-phosphate synthase
MEVDDKILRGNAMKLLDSNAIRAVAGLAGTFLICFAQLAGAADGGAVKLTVLYDAFGKQSALKKDWGYSALVEYGGKRILFDTGNNADILANNAKAKGVDLSRLDFVVMSHRHGDHMGGMEYLLSVNPAVHIYAPKDVGGVYGDQYPGSLYQTRPDPTLPTEERYFGGTPPEVVRIGSAWPKANISLVDKTIEIQPGMFLLALVSDKPGTMELRELSLAIQTPAGLVLVVGCSHPGIDRIMEAATQIEPRIHLLAGGMHLFLGKDADLERIVASLHDTYHVEYVAPGHCTGEVTFSMLKKAFGPHYVYAGLGTTLSIGETSAPVSSERTTSTVAMDDRDLASYRELLATSDENLATDLAGR